jgi:hypothetical protein
MRVITAFLNIAICKKKLLTLKSWKNGRKRLILPQKYSSIHSFLRFALSLVVPLEPIIKRLRVHIPPLELGERK